MEGDRFLRRPEHLPGKYFNPLPPHGGRRKRKGSMFLRLISIHSLRMEGDFTFSVSEKGLVTFQSTPSAWRETFHSLSWKIRTTGFQSTPSAWRETAKLHRKAFFISPILVQSCKKGCKRLHSAPEKMVFFEKREKNLVRNLQHLSVRL